MGKRTVSNALTAGKAEAARWPTPVMSIAIAVGCGSNMGPQPAQPASSASSPQLAATVNANQSAERDEVADLAVRFVWMAAARDYAEVAKVVMPHFEAKKLHLRYADLPENGPGHSYVADWQFGIDSFARGKERVPWDSVEVKVSKIEILRGCSRTTGPRQACERDSSAAEHDFTHLIDKATVTLTISKPGTETRLEWVTLVFLKAKTGWRWWPNEITAT